MATFLKAKLRNGTEVVSEFQKVKGVGGYAMQVMGGQKPFNVWRAVESAHPSGQVVSQRTRHIIAGRDIVDIVEVRPNSEDHNFDPANFTEVTYVQKGPGGRWTCPDTAPEGTTLVPGVTYPVLIDGQSARRYVIQATDVGDVPVKYYIDGRGENPRNRWSPGGSWADNDDDTF